MKQILLVLATLSYVAVTAQKQNNNWCFGNKAGINFNNSTPTVFTSSTDNRENGATVSDRRTGALLFYTEGMNIWNRNHMLMPNGSVIGNDTLFNCLQGAVIIPDPGDSNRYYVFSHEDQAKPNGDVFYSIVDMTLAGGLGDVLSGKKKVTLASGLAEGMTTCLACDGQWLILVEKNTHRFLAYKITTAGINSAPVVSQMNYPHALSGLTCIKISPNSKKLLFSVFATNNGRSIVTLNDFDVQTGLISNGLLIEDKAGADYYSCSFSPDGSKAYIAAYSGKAIHQYDLSLSTLPAISNSRLTVAVFLGNKRPGDIQIGLDSALYVSCDNSIFLDRITNPNTVTPVYTNNAVPLATGTNAQLSLPQPVLFGASNINNSAGNISHMNLCAGQALALEGPTGALSYRWQDSSTDRKLTVTQPGIYILKSILLCTEVTDTFVVEELDIFAHIGNDTVICKGDKIRLDVRTITGQVNFLWQDSSADDHIFVSDDGIYYVTVSSGNCTTSDTVIITVNDAARFELGSDSILCYGTGYTLKGPF